MKLILHLAIHFAFVSAVFSQAPARLEALALHYDIQDSIAICTPDGATISAVMVRKKGVNGPQPVVFQFTIYVRPARDLSSLLEAADRGYVGAIAYTRGKKFSPDPISIYEHDGQDAYAVIDWISQQPWCNGRIGMYGGSYNGFSQWAACKKLHPALKTIVPYVAAGPGLGWPMENNIFINPNYEWAFYVSNNKYLDTVAGYDRQRFRNMQNRWWESAAAYRTLDSIDGPPNKWFQRWISHPAYDAYWQEMVPYREDFAQIDIPVLTIDGYYNDSQNSSLYYLREHYKYQPHAEHYLIIGPYSHFGAQGTGEAILNGYPVDPDARINTPEITYQWLDHILKGAPKPAILQDKINYQVMGANTWRSAPRLEAMHNSTLKFYLSPQLRGDFHTLKPQKPKSSGFLPQQVDFADRDIMTNDYYPDPIMRREIDRSSGYAFVSAPFTDPLLVSGSFSGEIVASINKKDVDIGVVLYEITPEGEYFHLSYFVGRASYARDMRQRNLLRPGRKETLPFSNTRTVCKQLQAGSRLLVVIDVNKNSFSELNYGTGKPVREETIADANTPLKINWYNDSFVDIPVWKAP